MHVLSDYHILASTNAEGVTYLPTTSSFHASSNSLNEPCRVSFVRRDPLQAKSGMRRIAVVLFPLVTYRVSAILCLRATDAFASPGPSFMPVLLLSSMSVT